MLGNKNKEVTRMESGIPVKSRRHRAGEAPLLCPPKPPFLLSAAQAAALVRLIQNQLDAYAEAFSGTPRPGESEPFTEDDLGLVEPLLHWLARRI